jgi:hypoxanthine phosphoribosyltransferase
MDKQIKYVNISWDQIDKQCDKIAADIKRTNIIFDMIVAIGRGGMIPARIMSDRLGINNIQLFSIKLYKDVGQRNNKPTIENFSVSIDDKNILLIDDILDSGTTIDAAITYMQSHRRPISVKTATLLCKKSNKRKPTFFADECADDEWIVFPWEQ